MENTEQKIKSILVSALENVKQCAKSMENSLKELEKIGKNKICETAENSIEIQELLNEFENTYNKI